MVPVRRPRGPAQNGDAWDGCAGMVTREGVDWKTAQATKGDQKQESIR